MATRAKPGVRKKLSEYRHKRDFSKTAEPSGDDERGRKKKKLVFVIQKHAASHLHFDFRLELDGVMKSWAVPKGPSYDPSVKRLAMQVEDHPIDYNTFEGTIPKGEYGGGTVMLWDRGTYTSAIDPDDPVPELRRGYAKGDLKILMNGERMHGSWVLVRTRRGSEEKPQWLLIKHRDEFAKPGSDIVAKEMTSVVSGRTMDEIAANKRKKVWHSNRAGTSTPESDPDPQVREPKPTRARTKVVAASAKARAASAKALTTGALDPMLASVGTDIPEGSDWTFEPKYDGIRVLAYATADAARLVTRNGKDKTAQFPGVADAVRKLAARSRRAIVLDGEIVALEHGKPARFQELQQRMHVKDTRAIAGYESTAPVALMAFDILLDGDEVLVNEPWKKRRARLEKRLARHTSPELRLTESVVDDGRKMLERARADGWEGIIAKRVDAPYQPGIRSHDWLKLKLEFRQEFVVGGFTEPRNTRQHIGALLLGYYDHGRLIYAGNMGGGFDNAGLAEMFELLAPLERKTSPFEETPRPREPVHWVTPKVVVEVKFNEWTADGKLRQPIYVGTRDDKDPRTVKREKTSVQTKVKELTKGKTKRKSAPSRTKASGKKVVRKAARHSIAARAKKVASAKKTSAKKTSARASSTPAGSVEQQLAIIEQNGGDGDVQIKRGVSLHVSSLDKVYFPDDGITKGDVMRYYARVAPAILPAIADRPLVLKRTPEGIKGEVFFQQKPPQHVPPVVRVEKIVTEDGETAERIVGGDLATLLYTVQIGCISVDPWESRIGSLDEMDYTIIDLDPGPRATFDRVVEVARWVKENLDASGLRAALKTSGSRGLHVAIPLPPRTPYDAGLLLAQLIATRVAEAHPKEATVERSVKARPPAAVYVDYLQNVKGKSVAGAYCVRARPGATVSTPLQWKELKESLDPREFTIATVPQRIVKLGDIWGSAIKTRNSTAAIRAAADR
jgi:bifunctional non-homologous end joining protein LigD